MARALLCGGAHRCAVVSREHHSKTRMILSLLSLTFLLVAPTDRSVVVVQFSMASASPAAAAVARTTRAALFAALAHAAQDKSTYLHALPTLGPLQMVEQFVRRTTFGAGVVSAEPEFVEALTGEEQFQFPLGVASLPTGEVFVSDCTAHCVHVVDGASYSYIRKFGGKGSEPGSFSYLRGIACCNDRVLVADCGNDRVQVLSARGDFIRAFGTRGDADGQFRGLTGVACKSNGMIHTADANLKRIREFSPEGVFVRHILASSPGAVFQCPCGISCFADDSLVVADYIGHRVYVFRADGTFERTIGSGESEPFHSPSDVCVDVDDNFLVSDARGRVLVFRRDGTPVSTFGSQGTGNGEFDEANGMCVLDDGRVLVCDSLNERVHVRK